MSEPSSREQVERALARADEVDGLVGSVCTRADEAALAAADARDAERREGRVRGPLHGVPVLVKDNVDTADLPTTAGSLALAGQPPPDRDAVLVRRMREGGMVVLAKTNLSEWANIRDGSSTSGWSAYGGLTRNPWALNRSAGGSSSGSGAALAAGIGRLAIGTETDGSITCPAAFNGCVGLKPTVGTVPTGGVVPVSWSQDSPGPMAATVAEAAALLDVLAGPDPTRWGTGLASYAVERGVAGLRVGVPRQGFWGYSPHADGPAERVLSMLSAEGVAIVDPADLPGQAATDGEDELLVMLAELRAGLTTYLAGRPGDGPRDLAEVVAFIRAHADTELTHFGQSLFEQALTGPGVDSAEYAAARARCMTHGREQGIDAVLRDLRLDALLTPSMAPASPIDLVNAEFHPGSCTGPAARAGYPLLTVPSGVAAGLPVAVTLWGTAGSEPTLVALGHAVETARVRAHGPFPSPDLAPFR